MKLTSLVFALGLLLSLPVKAYDMVANNNGVEVTLTNMSCPSGGTNKLAYIKGIDGAIGTTCFYMKASQVVLLVPGTNDTLSVPGRYFRQK